MGKVEARCRRCGGSDFYRNVQVSGTGWVHADVWAFSDGGVDGETHGRVEDPDIEVEFEDQWGCAGCGAEKSKLADLIEPALGPLASTFSPGEVVYDRLKLRGVVEKAEDGLVWLRGFPVPYYTDDLSRATHGLQQVVVFDHAA